MALSKIPSAGFQDNVKFRNIIINGDMSIAQRSTSVSGITGDGYNTTDRWYSNISSMGTWTQSQSTDVPTAQGFAKSLKMDCTTADASPSASDYLLILQKFEGQNLQYLKKGTSSAESLTCSFWVKSNKTGTYICELYDHDNNRSISKSYTIDSASTWEKKILTFAGDTSGVMTNDNNLSLQVAWWLGAGTNFTSGTLQTTWGTPVTANRVAGQVNLADSTSNEWFVTGVQLESGTVASSFETLPTDINLMRCQRYYFKSSTFCIARGYGSYGEAQHIFPATMRATPTITGSTVQANASNSNVSGQDTGIRIYAQFGTGTVNYYGLENYKADAEL